VPVLLGIINKLSLLQWTAYEGKLGRRHVYRLKPLEADRENVVTLAESDRTRAVCGKGPAQCKNLEAASTARNCGRKQ
jgi:hypothetical protein